MTEEDEAFNDIERQAKQRKESVKAAVEKPQRTWVGLTDEEIDQGLCRTNHAMQTAGAWRLA